MASLLEQFAEEEATPYVRGLILEAVRERESNPARELTHFHFNRFDITLDFASGTVLIEDELNFDPVANEVRLSLAEFIRYLSSDGPGGHGRREPST
jgi:hypothetical protein